MISDQEGPRVLDFTGGGELSGWVRSAESLTLRDIPLLITAPDGMIVRATEKAADLAGEASPTALIGRKLDDVLVEDDPACWLRGRGAMRLVRLVSWQHIEDERLRITALVDVSTLVTDSGRNGEHEPAAMRGDQTVKQADRDTGERTRHPHAAGRGDLVGLGRQRQRPTKTQGLMVTDEHFVYSTSYGRGNRSNIYVVERGEPDLDQARLRCFRAPSMAEEITEYGGKAHLVFESASHVYRGDSSTRNVIPDLHEAEVADLIALVG